MGVSLVLCWVWKERENSKCVVHVEEGMNREFGGTRITGKMKKRDMLQRQRGRHLLSVVEMEGGNEQPVEKETRTALLLQMGEGNEER